MGAPDRQSVRLFDRPGDGSICSDTPPVGDGKGICAEGPLDTYCTNHPHRLCTTDGDCDGVPGTCVDERPRGCYVGSGMLGASFQANGVADAPVADVSRPTLASVFCSGPTASASVNIVWGLPGPSRLILEGDARFRP